MTHEEALQYALLIALHKRQKTIFFDDVTSFVEYQLLKVDRFRLHTYVAATGKEALPPLEDPFHYGHFYYYGIQTEANKHILLSGAYIIEVEYWNTGLESWRPWILDLYPEGTDAPPEGAVLTTPVGFEYWDDAGLVTFNYVLNKLVPESSNWMNVVDRAIASFIALSFSSMAQVQRGTRNGKVPPSLKTPQVPDRSRQNDISPLAQINRIRLVASIYARARGGRQSSTHSQMPSRLGTASEAIIDRLLSRVPHLPPQLRSALTDPIQDAIRLPKDLVDVPLPLGFTQGGDLLFSYTQDMDPLSIVGEGEEESRQRVKQLIGRE